MVTRILKISTCIFIARWRPSQASSIFLGIEQLGLTTQAGFGVCDSHDTQKKMIKYWYVYEEKYFYIDIRPRVKFLSLQKRDKISKKV